MQHERKLPDYVHSALRESIDPSSTCSLLVGDGEFPPGFSPPFHGHGLGCQPPSTPPTQPWLLGRCCLLPQAHPSTFTRSITHPHAPRHLHTHTLSPCSFTESLWGITDFRISLATGVWGTVCCSESLLWEAPDSPRISALYTFINTSQYVTATCLPHQTGRSCRTGAVLLSLLITACSADGRHHSDGSANDG